MAVHNRIRRPVAAVEIVARQAAKDPVGPFEAEDLIVFVGAEQEVVCGIAVHDVGGGKVQADQHRIVVRVAGRRGPVEERRVATEVQIVVDGIRFIGVDVPFGNPGHAPLGRLVGQDVIQRSGLAVEDEGVDVLVRFGEVGVQDP